MAKPIIAVVGRPNVGKSTLFNKLIGKRLSIVDDTPGVTRDRIYGDTEWRGRKVMLVDTGGIEPKTNDIILSGMRSQAQLAIDTANVIIMVVDMQTGVTATDAEIASMLLKSGKPIVLCVNKCDRIGDVPPEFYEFYNLGLGDPIAVSSVHGTGTGDLLDAAYEFLPDTADENDEDVINVAVIGKPNAGKSSLVNKITGEERSIVSDIAGTTRDAIDTLFERNGKKYTIIDTAGIRKKRSVDDDVEYYSNMRAFDAVRRSDVCALVVDANEGLTEQDVKIIGYVHEQGKPSVIVMNKWDLVEKDTHTVNKFEEKLQNDLKFMSYYKSLYISAKTGQRAEKLLSLCDEVYAHATFRVPTGALNDLIGDAVRISEPPSYLGRRMKIYYSSQVSVCPPTFALFVNDEGLMHFSYERYLENVIRGAYDFSGTPIKIVVRERKDEE